MLCVAYGAELIEVTQQQGMEVRTRFSLQMQAEGKGLCPKSIW